MNLIDKFVALLAWVQIMIAPFSGGVIIGFLVWGSRKDTTGMIVGIVIALVGLVMGIMWAEKIRKREGTMTFISKARSSPELDDPEIYKDDKKK